MSIIDLLFPQQVKCVVCRDETDKFGLCDNCRKDFSLISGNACERCGINVGGQYNVCIECKGRILEFEKNFSIFVYDGIVRDKILLLKQNKAKYIGYMFAHFIAEKYEEISKVFDIDFIIPMPISNARLKERKYNQSELLCNELLYTNKVDTSLLIRDKDTPHQTGLSRENRLANLDGAFKVTNKKIIRNKTILLVDDIYTTGSTLNECARTLKKSGASRVISLCLARTPIRLDGVVEKKDKNTKETIKSKNANNIAFK